MTLLIPPRARRFLYSTILLALSLLFSFVVCEGILRLLGYRGSPQSLIRNVYFVDDPILDWRRLPNSEYTEGPIDYKYNTFGFRDIDHTFLTPAHKQRIVVLGDSITEGYGVEWRSVFAPYIQSRLGDGFEVINIAASGLNTPQEIHLFSQTGLQCRPELLVLNFVLNDCDFYSNFKSGQKYAALKDSRIDLIGLSVDPGVKRVLKSSAFLYFVKQNLEDLIGRFRGIPKTDYYSEIWEKQENRKKITTGFDQLAALQKENGFDVLVIIWPLLTSYDTYRFQSIHQWVKDQAQKRDFSTIDLLAKFSSFPYRKLQITSEDSTHPNALGHEIAAETFLAWYRAKGRQQLSQVDPHM